MEHLNRLIKDASNQFECHNFQTSLSLYVRCIEKCVSENLPKYVLNNLKSSEAALRTILGEYDRALKLLNQVLSEDKQHWLSLVRRSQVYKKQAKYKKAMKDLDILTMYAPDNMQVVALKLELKGFMTKSADSSSQSQENQENIDEQAVLQFSNLKRIDRTSVSIMVPKGKSRQSRVTISGDKSFFYEQTTDNNNKERIRQSKSYTPSFNCKRFIEIDKQLEQTVNSEKQIPPVVVKAKPTRSKSILKNRNSEVYVGRQLDPLTNEQQQKLLSKVQDIDGVIIASVSKIDSSHGGSEREVNFRKSSFMEQPEAFDQVKIQPKGKSKLGGRKSCLKNTSFCTMIEETSQKKAGPRRSKFQSMSRNSIDGKILKGDKKKKQSEIQASKQNINRRTSVGHSNNDSDNQSEEGSQFNIFGSKKVVLNQQLRQNLGLGSDSIVDDSQPKIMKQKPARGVSILKATSIVVKKDVTKKKASVFFKESEQQKQKPERKAKKSVMFRAE